MMLNAPVEFPVRTEENSVTEKSIKLSDWAHTVIDRLGFAEHRTLAGQVDHIVAFYVEQRYNQRKGGEKT